MNPGYFRKHTPMIFVFIFYRTWKCECSRLGIFKVYL